MKNTSLVAVVIVGICLRLALFAGQKEQNKEAHTVDSGSFGIFVSGRRIGTETFTIQQKPEISVANSEVKIEDGGTKASQSSELRLTPAGDLSFYRWRELSPGKGETTVQYKDQFLVEHLTAKPGDKPSEQAFMLPSSTMVLDDNFFTHREILVWRYIAASCGKTVTAAGCKLERGQFGVFVPHQAASLNVSLEYRGREKVNIRGGERELDHFALLADGVEWGLWVDQAYKVQRIFVPSERVEVVRD